MRKATVKVLLKPSGIPDAEISVLPGTDDAGQLYVTLVIKVVTLVDSNVVARVTLCEETARTLIAALMLHVNGGTK